MILQPCQTCRHSVTRFEMRFHGTPQCQRKQVMQMVLQRHRLTVARFRCPELLAEYTPGTRVVATIFNVIVGHESCGSPRFASVDFRATVMRWSGRKVLVWLDDSEEGETEKRAVKIKPCNLVPTGERVEVCEECGRPVSAANVGDWVCERCGKARSED